MKYTLTFFAATTAIALHAQSMLRHDAPLRGLRSRNDLGSDTVGFNTMPKVQSFHGNSFENFEYPIQGKTTTAYYSITGVDGAVVIQNSLPKGGKYTAANGGNYGHAISWYRVTNETNTPLEITISFDAFTISPTPNGFLKIFIPPDTMSLDKTMLYDYGVADLESIVGADFHTPTAVQRTLNPNEEFLFYIGLLVSETPPPQANGSLRASLILKEQNLFYSLTGAALDTLIPCGRIVVKR